ncbi:hypothetical protein Ddc_19813 [Ditylenchus destructor]|nr:hypothetical protein Ddc_19813 [Ditylenchus destructor]
MHSFVTCYSYALTIYVIHLAVLLESSHPVNAFLPTIPNFLPYMSAHLEKWDTNANVSPMRMFDHNDRKFYNREIHKFDTPPSKTTRDWSKVLTAQNPTAQSKIQQRDRSLAMITKPSVRPMLQKFSQIISQRYLSGCYADSRKTNPESGQTSRKKQFSMLFYRFALHRYELRSKNYARDIVCE